MKPRRLLISYGIPTLFSVLLGGGSALKLLPFDWLEAFGFITGAWGVWLQVRESVWNWPVQLVSSALYVVVFFKARLFADTGLNAVYIGLYVLGWYWWLRGGPDRGELVIHRTPLRLAALLAVITVAATAGWTVVLTSINDSAPFLDALTTAVSLVALFLTARKLLESWWVWIVVNIVYIGLYTYKSLPLTAVLYGLFAALSVAGLLNWQRLWRRQQVGAGAVPAGPIGAGVNGST